METESRILPSLLLVAVAFGTVLEAVNKWPAGTYGIPRAQSGCPSSFGFTWRTGWRYQDTSDFFPSNKHSNNFHLDASVDKNNLKRAFCMKTDKAKDASRPRWPKGKYCIYKKGSCPTGFQNGYITWDDEDWFNKNNKGGILPDGVYGSNTKIYYCCRTDGNKVEPIELPTIKPFFLVAYGSASCQQVMWAQASSEWIRFDTEEDDDGYGGAYPYGAGMNDHTVHYCYYSSCNYTLTSSSGSFQSPNYPNSYPAGQYCSWRMKVPEGLQVVLRFPEFTLQKGINTDNVQLFDGKNETSPSLGVYSGDKLPAPFGVRSSSNEMFVIFKTDNKINFPGFKASYSAQRPTQPPSTVTTSSNVCMTTSSTTVSTSTTRKRLSTKPTFKTTVSSRSTQTSAPTATKTTHSQTSTQIPSSRTTAQTTNSETTAQKTHSPVTAQTTHVPTTAGKTPVGTTVQGTKATTAFKSKTSTTATVKTSTSKSSPSTTTSASTIGRTTGTENTTKPVTSQGITTESSSKGVSVTTGSTKPRKTGPTNESLLSTQETLRNESSISYSKKEPDNGSSNVPMILAPVLCLLLLGFCLFTLFLYRRRDQKRNKMESKQIVYYESNPKSESVDNPLYESGVEFSSGVSTENPIYDAGAELGLFNPLYHSKLEITEVYQDQSTQEDVMRPLESNDIRECQNPLYGAVTTADESFA